MAQKIIIDRGILINQYSALGAVNAGKRRNCGWFAARFQEAASDFNMKVMIKG